MIRESAGGEAVRACTYMYACFGFKEGTVTIVCVQVWYTQTLALVWCMQPHIYNSDSPVWLCMVMQVCSLCRDDNVWV